MNNGIEKNRAVLCPTYNFLRATKVKPREIHFKKTHRREWTGGHVAQKTMSYLLKKQVCVSHLIKVCCHTSLPHLSPQESDRRQDTRGCNEMVRWNKGQEVREEWGRMKKLKANITPTKKNKETQM